MRNKLGIYLSNRKGFYRRCVAVCLFLVLLVTPLEPGIVNVTSKSSAATSSTVAITVSVKEGRKAISPYIYGVNDWVSLSGLTTTALRQGGNRMTGYNWETNASNAGSDWYHYNDNYLVSGLSLSEQKTPGIVTLNLSKKAAVNKVPYTIATLQMAGYVANDMNREVLANEAAPSARWAEVIFDKPGSLSLSPDINDGKVYMEEYLNYLINKLGNSKTPTGIKGYSLDNEPGLWSQTHSLLYNQALHPNGLTSKELVARSTSLAKVIKKVDANAMVYGPALYGFNAYETLQNASDINSVKTKYKWFIDYYLDEMRKASESANVRLLDVLDIHYYSEHSAPGCKRVTQCTNYSHTACNNARMQATRTLWQDGYKENSWIGTWKQQFLPIIPTIQESIAKYYKGTKLSITEYNFGGGGHVSGGIAEVDALGSFASNEVYLATLWPEASSEKEIAYQKAAINLFTNYDGLGKQFGNTLVKTNISDDSKVSAYSSITNTDTSTVKMVLTNKNTIPTKVTVSIPNDSYRYTAASVYGFNQYSSQIKSMAKVSQITDNRFTYELPGLSAVTLTISGVKKVAPIKPTAISLKSISKGKLTLYTKKTKRIEFNVTPSKASKSVTYTSSNKSVATVSSKGLITAKKSGKATITVRSKLNTKIYKKITVTVKKSTVSISASNQSFKKRTKKHIKYTVKKYGAANSSVTFTSSKKSVATISKTGLVTARKKGTTYITIRSKYDTTKYKKIKVTIK